MGMIQQIDFKSLGDKAAGPDIVMRHVHADYKINLWLEQTLELEWMAGSIVSFYKSSCMN